jgi:all-trans-retinol 13,14-reductase
MKYDVIIIGGGLGGLTAGAKLSREGKKVLLIEQHDRPGGCATTFKRGDFIFEVGLHEMYGPAPGDIQTKIFNDLEVFKNVEFIGLPEFYRFVNEHVDVTIPHDSRIAEERLCCLFPDETLGIKAYFDQILKPKKRATENNLPEISTGEFLDSIINEEDLKLILLGNLGYYHDNPYSLSLSYYSICQGRYFSGGASFIKGGSQKLSDHLVAYIRNHGGEVLLNHVVTAIKTDNHKATGVLFKKKNDPGTGNMEASANDIIANTAMPNIVDLLPEEYGSEFMNELQHQKTGVSLLTLYLGFNKPVKELGYKYYSTFVYDNNIKSQKDIFKNNTNDFSIRNFTFIDYSQIDSCLAPAGKSIGTICCIDNLKDWENLDRDAYISKKEMVALALIERLEKLIPGIKNIIEYYEVGTPSTLKRYTLNPGGAVYGFAQTQSKKIIDTSKLPDNLHFASAWGAFGGGFTGAIYSGYFCATSIMRRKQGAIL